MYNQKGLSSKIQIETAHDQLEVQERSIDSPTGNTQSFQPFSVYVRIRPVLKGKKLKQPANGQNRPNSLIKSQSQSLVNDMQIRGQNNQILQIFDNPDRVHNHFSTGYLQADIDGSQNSQSFLFDKVFGDDQSNLDVFQNVLQPLIPQLLNGYNTTCFAYGMTGSGKTHTMLGKMHQPDQEMSEADKFEQLKGLGLCNLAIQNLFYQMYQRQDDWSYHVTVSFLEIYNEQVRDLLSDLKDADSVREQMGEDFDLKQYIGQILKEGVSSSQDMSANAAFNNYAKKRPSTSVPLKIVEDPVKGIVVQNLQEIAVYEASELMDLIQLGSERRFVASTGANKTSSRSHAILIFNIEGQSQRQIDDENHIKVTRSKLQMIDLAGSERAQNTDNRGQRMVEGANINRSLLALGQCIHILSEKCKKEYHSLPSSTGNRSRSRGMNESKQPSLQKHIPYRDSKLTRLLKDSLGGSTKTVMIATINQTMATYEETMNTIKYASKARSIENKKVKNEIIQREYMKEQKAEEDRVQQEREMMQIQSLKKEIEVMKSEVQEQIGGSIGKPIDQKFGTIDGGQRKQGSLPKHFPSGDQIDSTSSFNAYVNNKLIPNVITQYNLRQQLQSQNILRDFKNAEVDTEQIDSEIQRIQAHLQDAQLKQQLIQNTISTFVQDLSEQAVQKAESVYKKSDEAQMHSKAQEVLIENLQKQIKERDKVIAMSTVTQSKNEEYINTYQQSTQNFRKKIKEQQVQIESFEELRAHFEAQIYDKDQEIRNLKEEVKAMKGTDQKEQGKVNEQRSQKDSQMRQIGNIKLIQLEGLVNQPQNMQQQNTFSGKRATLPKNPDQSPDLGNQKLNFESRKQSFVQKELELQASNKINSAQITKKQRSLKRYLSNAVFGGKKDSGANSKQNSNNYNSFVQVNNNSKHRPTDSSSQLKNNQQDNAVYMDFRNQKVAKIEDKIFGSQIQDQRGKTYQKIDKDQTVSQKSRNDAQAVSNTQPQPSALLSYPQLRKSENTTRFQKNLQPRSNSRQSAIQLNRSRSNSRVSHPYNKMGRSFTNVGINFNKHPEEDKMATLENHNPLLDDTEDYKTFLKQRQSFGLQQSHSQQQFRINASQSQLPNVEPFTNQNPNITYHQENNSKRFFDPSVGFGGIQNKNHVYSQIEDTIPNLLNVSDMSLEEQRPIILENQELSHLRRHSTVRDSGKISPKLENVETMRTASKRQMVHSQSQIDNQNFDTEIRKSNPRIFDLRQNFSGSNSLITPEPRRLLQKQNIVLQNSGSSNGQRATEPRVNQNTVAEQQQAEANQKISGFNINQVNRPRATTIVRELQSYADIRRKSKMKNQENAVKNLALNFQNFKDDHQEKSERQIQNQIFIVDSLQQELNGHKGDKNASYFVNTAEQQNRQMSTLFVQDHQYFNNQQLNPINSERNGARDPNLMTQFVKQNEMKIQEIQFMADHLELRSLERQRQENYGAFGSTVNYDDEHVDHRAMSPIQQQRENRRRSKSLRKRVENGNSFEKLDLTQERRHQRSIQEPATEAKNQTQHIVYMMDENSQSQMTSTNKHSPIPKTSQKRVPNFCQPQSKQSPNLVQKSRTLKLDDATSDRSQEIFQKFEKTLKHVRNSLQQSPIIFSQNRANQN